MRQALGGCRGGALGAGVCEPQSTACSIERLRVRHLLRGGPGRSLASRVREYEGILFVA